MKKCWVFFLFFLPIAVNASDNGIIQLKDGDFLKDAVLSGSSGIVIEGDANVTIKNCIINTNKKIAVEALPGSGTVTISDSQITSQAGKGLYIQPGRTVNIYNSNISHCQEEGLDVRNAISGFITNNKFENNGESGIELIVGKTNLEINKNVFSGNGASGLALQFYTFTRDEGKIKLFQNGFEKNQKYGIDCSIPEGKQPPDYYWYESIKLTDNKFSQNVLGNIEKDCNYPGPVDEKDREIAKKTATEFENANIGLQAKESSSWEIIKKIWEFLTRNFDKTLQNLLL
ncbi:MAG: right-handed parallel beta-helix repeat-containing protein [Candidatus Moranbacteria bacterium]|nr:right-handed parallel beta-helix repeat-containing protein [Candidatus Moranbacteria bacterium]